MQGKGKSGESMCIKGSLVWTEEGKKEEMMMMMMQWSE
jgi:hypothetical protein